MRLLRRIVESPSAINRADINTRVIPVTPDVSQYEDRLYNMNDYSPFLEVLNAQKYKSPKLIRYNYLVPKEVGYIVEYEGELYGVPISRLKKFMQQRNVERTDRDSKYDLYAVIDNNLIVKNNQPCTEEGDVVFIYYTDTSTRVPAKLPIDLSFRVRFKDGGGVKEIHAKGYADVPGLKLFNEQLLPVLKGEIVHVSGYNEHLSS